MEVQEICKKLKPIIGEKAERYWLAYLSEDFRGKQELEIAIQMMGAKLLGTGIESHDVHLSAPHREIARGDYPIGNVVYCDKPMHLFGIRENEWIQHTAIFGRSGAGKTNTVFIIIEDFLNHHKPFLIFDWKRNYRDLLAMKKDAILVYTVGRQTVPFTFNPLIPPEGTDPSVWLKKLIEIIAHSYYLGEGVMFLLQEALHAVYRDFGVYNDRPKKCPTFRDVLQWLEDHPVKGRKALWMDSTMRGVKSICFGHMGNVVNTAMQSNLSALLDKNVILELDGLTNADKTFIIESMLLWIHHYRLSQPHRETFKHAIIIEEAHHILLKRTGGSGGEAITDTIIREIRELGEAIVLVDQHPSLISIPALGNTYTTIAMNLKHKSDVNAVGAAMLMEEDERDILGRLPIGSAVVKLQGRWQEPFLITIPLRNIVKGAVDDAALVQLMAQRDVLNPPAGKDENGHHREEGSAALSEREERFLRDVAEHPLFGSVERYKSLCLSRRKGNTLRESCIKKGLIVPIDIPTRSGKTVLLELTDEGKRALHALGYDVSEKFRQGSLEHEYWKHKVAEKLKSDGWTVALEEPVNGYADILAEKDGQKIAVEIETGKSDWRANVEKNRQNGITTVIIVATNGEAFEKISIGVKKTIQKINIHVVQAQEFV